MVLYLTRPKYQQIKFIIYCCFQIKSDNLILLKNLWPPESNGSQRIIIIKKLLAHNIMLYICAVMSKQLKRKENQTVYIIVLLSHLKLIKRVYTLYFYMRIVYTLSTEDKLNRCRSKPELFMHNFICVRYCIIDWPEKLNNYKYSQTINCMLSLQDHSTRSNNLIT